MSYNETKLSELEFDSFVDDEDIVDTRFIIYRCTACNQTVVGEIQMPSFSLELKNNFCPLCGAKIVEK